MSDTDDLYFTFELTNEDNINAEFELTDSPQVDAIFEINAAGTTWGSINGDIENQADLIAVLNSKATNEALTALALTVTNNYTTLDTKIDGVQSDLSGNISVLNTAVQNEATTRANNDTLLQNGINTLTSNLSAEISNRTTADNTLQSNITAINNTLAGYGNIVTHNVSEFATAAQGLLAGTALQPNDNITKLTNNVGYITLSALNGYATEDFVTSQGYLSSISSSDVTNALGYTPYNATNPNGYISGINSTDVVTALGYTPYDSANPDGYITSASLPTVNNNTITIQKNNTDVGSFTLNQSSNDTINITVPTDTNDLTNGAGFITSASLPTLEDLTTTAQLAAINSGATTTNIGQIATNATDIGNEVTNRQNADNALQSQIDAIVSASDVFDIVGTYAELQAYDISTVPVNDIIKVLVDSTHSGAATYYRCVENNNVKSWSYIGSEGAYYTKGEADSKFVAQTITVNGQALSSNVTLTASDVGALPSSTTIGAGVLTVQKNGTTIDTFGANDTGNTTINITVPTDTGDLTNNAGFITGITGTDVTNALGYTPYDSSNPSGYTSNLGTVTSVNNVSPVSGNVTLSIPTATSDLTNDSGFITTSDLTNYVTTNTDQDITGTKTFIGQKKIGFKQSGNSDKLGFTLYTSNNTEKGYLEFNPSNTVDNVPLMTLGNYASSAAALTHVGFRKYSSVSGANGAYNLLTPLISDAKTPFNLTTTYTNFYLPLGFTDGTTTVKTAKSGLVDLSSLLPNSAVWGNITGTLSNQTDLSNALSDKQDTLVSGTNIKTVNNTSLLGSGDISVLQNTATGTNALTILGNASTYSGAVNIGYGSNGTGQNAVAIGIYASAPSTSAIAIGYGASSSQSSAIQLGSGTNSTPNTLNVGFSNANTNYQLLDGTTGLIPDARISSNIARTSAIPDISNLISNTDYATTSTKGIVQPDGSTITVSNGVISATPARNIGEIVQSTIPLTDAGLHLLDGALIDGSGVYASFVQYIASFYGQEEAWTQPVLNSNGIMGGDSFAVSASSEYDSNFVAYHAFDGNTSTEWATLGNSTPCYISFYSPTPIKVSQLTMTNRNTAETFTGGTVYGSNDGVNWTSLTTYSNSVTTGGAVWTISLSSNTNFYNYYKIEAASLYGTNCGFANIGITATQMKYPIFTDETSFQNMVSTYGVCGRFVYDNVNNTVRLPKITGIIEGTVDATALGDLVQAGLPNITANSGQTTYNASDVASGAFQRSNSVLGYGATTNSNWVLANLTFDASRSNPIYGNSTTVQPQTIKAFIYIVIATSAKTDIQVDIDEIATDLNGKADTDLSNCTRPHIVETYSNGFSWYRVYSDGWCEQGGCVQPSSSTLNYQVVFIKPFINNNYNIAICANSIDAWTSISTTVGGDSIILWTAAINRKSTTGFYFCRAHNVWQSFWVASGYIS